jgi:hypothetical protein
LPPPSSDTVWELSRFAVTETKARASSYRAERLLLAALRYCNARNVTHLLAVSTLPVERLMQRAGVDLHRIGPPAFIGGQPILAFAISINESTMTALEAFESAPREQSMNSWVARKRPASTVLPSWMHPAGARIVYDCETKPTDRLPTSLTPVFAEPGGSSTFHREAERAVECAC